MKGENRHLKLTSLSIEHKTDPKGRNDDKTKKKV